MTNEPGPNSARPKWSKRLKATLAGLALAGVLFSGAAVAASTPSDSDETARSSDDIPTSGKLRFVTKALTWS